MAGTRVYLHAVLALMLCSPSVPVNVYTHMPRVEVRESEDAVLTCIFHTEREQSPRIEWKKKGRDVSFVYFQGQFRGPYEGRAVMDGATVTLKSVTQEDAGEYRCEVSAPGDTVSLGETNITLRVLVPPQVPSCHIPSSALTGSGVQLRCRDSHSVPPATYVWYKDKQRLAPPTHNSSFLLNPATGVLDIKTVAKADSGHYQCLARNSVGQSQLCEGKNMVIEDINVVAVVAGVVTVALLFLICACGGYVLHRNGTLSRHRGRNNINYVPPPQEDFKHTQSFML